MIWFAARLKPLWGVYRRLPVAVQAKIASMAISGAITAIIGAKELATKASESARDRRK